MSSLPGDEAPATDAKSQLTTADPPPSPLSPKPEAMSFPPKKRYTMSSLPGDEALPDQAQATDPDLPLPPPMYVLVSKDKARITIPLCSARLSYKILHDGGKSEISCDIDTLTLVKIVPYMILHSGCSEDGNRVEMNMDELHEWDHSVFLNEPFDVLERMHKAAMWLEVPGMVHLIETKTRSR